MREEKLRAGFYVTTRKRAERFGKYDPKIVAYYWDQGELEQLTDPERDQIRELLEAQGYDGIEIVDRKDPEMVIFPNSLKKLK